MVKRLQTGRYTQLAFGSDSDLDQRHWRADRAPVDPHTSQSHLFGQAQFDVQRFLGHEELEGCVCCRGQFTVLLAELDLTDAQTNRRPANMKTP